MKRAHRHIVRAAEIDSKLSSEIIQRVERMAGIETLLIFSVAALNLAVMSGRVGTDQLVADTEFLRSLLEKRL